MDINQLKTFITIAAEGNLTRASEKLFTSQPAVSSQLKLMEDELGFQLFIRTPKGMTLTDNGQKMLGEAQTVVNSYNSMLENAQKLQENSSKHINIGTNTDSSILKIEKLLKHTSDREINLRFRFIQTKSEDFVRDVTSNSIDAGFFYGEISSNLIEYTKLVTYSLDIVYPPAWKPEIEKASIEELAEFPWIWTTSNCPFSKASSDFFTKKGVKPKKVMYVDDETLVGKLVNSEVGCSILAQPIAEKLKEENLVEINNALDTEVNLNFGYLKDKKNTPEILEIKNTLKDVWQLS